jgi:hypothetical protein
MPGRSLPLDAAARRADGRTLSRGLFLGAAFAGMTTYAVAATNAAPARRVGQMTIYRDTGCTCCEGWAAAMSAAGYANTVKEIEHDARLRRFSIPAALAGCHTAVADGYLLEGHVPIQAVAKLFAERPKTRGISAPGMPSGTPGMPGPASHVAVVFLDDPQRVFYTS